MKRHIQGSLADYLRDRVIDLATKALQDTNLHSFEVPKFSRLQDHPMCGPACVLMPGNSDTYIDLMWINPRTECSLLWVRGTIKDDSIYWQNYRVEHDDWEDHEASGVMHGLGLEGIGFAMMDEALQEAARLKVTQ